MYRISVSCCNATWCYCGQSMGLYLDNYFLCVEWYIHKSTCMSTKNSRHSMFVLVSRLSFSSQSLSTASFQFAPGIRLPHWNKSLCNSSPVLNQLTIHVTTYITFTIFFAIMNFLPKHVLAKNFHACKMFSAHLCVHGKAID